MAINKVIYDGNTLIDLTEDTVDSSNLLAGYTAHDRSGAEITGSFDSSIFVLKAGDTMTGALTLSGAPTSNLHAATKQYVDDNVGVVKQEDSTANKSYRVLLSKNANDSTETDQVYKSGGLRYNPGLGYLYLDKIHSNTTTQIVTLAIGNSTASGTAGSSSGSLILYTNSSTSVTLSPYPTIPTSPSSYTIYLPIPPYDSGGSVRYLAMTSAADGDARKVQQNEDSSSICSILLASGNSNQNYLAHTKKNYGFKFATNSAKLTLYRYHTGTTTQSGTIELGNSTNNGSVGASYGCIRIYGKNTRYVDVYDKNTALSANRELYLPDKSGTIAITDDLSSYLPLIGGTLTGNLTINHLGGDGSASVGAELTLGNNIEWDQENSSFGYINLYSTGTYKCSLRTANIITSDKVLCLPNKNGTLATTDDLNNYISKSGGTITGGFLIITDTSLESGSASAYLTLGNNVDSSSEGSSFGVLNLYSTGIYKSSIRPTTLTDNRQLYFPDKDGTLAVTDDLYSQKLNSTNIIDKSMFTMGSLSGAAGTDTYADTRLRSAFIPVNANTTYSISTGNSLLIYEIHEYMSGKTFIQYTSVNATSKTFKTNASTSFIKILLRKTTNDAISLSDVGNIQMNKGDSLETFKNYIPDIKEIGAYNVYAYSLSHRFIQDQSLSIPANSNINSLPYLRPGQYVCNNYQTSLSITNIPKQDVFTMLVESPISDIYNDEVNTSYGRYRTRTIKYTNGDTWVQTCSAQASSTSWTYGAWQLVIIGYKAGNLVANASGSSFAETYCKQYGKTVNVRAWITGLSTTTQTHTNIITVQLVDMPTTPVRFVFTCWLGNGIAAYAGYGVMDTSGRITLVKAVANSDKASFEFTYNV